MVGGAALLIIPVTTVGKVLLTSVAGFLASKAFQHGDHTVTGLTYASMRVFLPCLLFSNLCLAVTWSVLGSRYWAVVLPLVPMLLGYLASRAFAVLLPKEWHGVLTLGCTFQNGLIFPLSVVLSLKGIDWLDADGLAAAQQAMFLYNLPTSIALWAVGEPMVRAHKAALDAAAVTDNDEHEMQHHDTDHDDDGRFSHNNCPVAAAAASQLPLLGPAQEERQTRLLTPGTGVQLGSNADTAVVGGGQGGEPGAPAARSKSVAEIIYESLRSPPVVASLSALTISLLPPLRWLFDGISGHILLGGMRIIGSGTIPLQLLLLGATLTGPSTPKVGTSRGSTGGEGRGSGTPHSGGHGCSCPSSPQSPPHFGLSPSLSQSQMMREEDEAVRHSGTHDSPTVVAVVAGTNERGVSERLRSWLDMYIPQPLLFTALTCVLRLLLVPAASFLVVHMALVAGVMPTEKTFLLPVLIGLCSPSAVNSSLICSIHNYKAVEYARMIFVMYVAAIFTATMWLVLALWYVEQYGTL